MTTHQSGYELTDAHNKKMQIRSCEKHAAWLLINGIFATLVPISFMEESKMLDTQRTLTPKQEKELAWYRVRQAFKKTLPCRVEGETSLRPTKYKAHVGVDTYGRSKDLVICEVSYKHDLWVLYDPVVQDCYAWNNDKECFEQAGLIEKYDHTFDAALFNNLTVIMSRLPQAIAFFRKRRYIV